MTAWGFDFNGIAVYASLDRSELDAWPEIPALVLDERDGGVYVIDRDGSRRHVTSPESMEAWHFTYDHVVTLDGASIDGFPVGVEMPFAPLVVQADGHPEVHVLDVFPLPATDDNSAPGNDEAGEGEGDAGNDGAGADAAGEDDGDDTDPILVRPHAPGCSSTSPAAAGWLAGGLLPSRRRRPRSDDPRPRI